MFYIHHIVKSAKSSWTLEQQQPHFGFCFLFLFLFCFFWGGALLSRSCPLIKWWKGSALAILESKVTSQQLVACHAKDKH